MKRIAMNGRMGGAIALTLLMTGCPTPGQAPETVPPLVGTVDFGTRKTQATLTDVALAATVSLIDTTTNNTVGSTVTNSTGAFVLSFGTAFKPGTKVYYLEASKGLSNNLAGHDAVRLRTIARYQVGGWVTMTNILPNTGIRLNLSTTALSVIASLEGTASVSPTDLLGTVTSGLDATLAPSTPDTFASTGTGITNAAFHQVYGLVDRLLTNDFDPIDGVTKQSSTYVVADDIPLGLPPTLQTIVPASGSVGTTVTLYGTDFGAQATDNTVTFNGATASILASSPTQLTLSVPAGATTGPVTVRTSNGTSAPVTFTVTTAGATDIGGSFSAR